MQHRGDLGVQQTQFDVVLRLVTGFMWLNEQFSAALRRLSTTTNANRNIAETHWPRNIDFVLVYLQSYSDFFLFHIRKQLAKIYESMREQGDVIFVVKVFKEKWHSPFIFHAPQPRRNGECLGELEEKLSVIKCNPGELHLVLMAWPH